MEMERKWIAKYAKQDYQEKREWWEDPAPVIPGNPSPTRDEEDEVAAKPVTPPPPPVRTSPLVT